MKIFKRAIAGIMCVVMLLAFSVNTFAIDMSEAEWAEYYATCDNTGVMLTPGTDETEVSFAWHSEWSVNMPKVRISKNADMSDYTEFTGYATFSENSDQRSNNVTVTGLEENTTYYYVYGTKGNFSAPEEYKTHSFDNFKCLFVSDVQPNSESEKKTLEEQTFSWNQSLEAAFTAHDDLSFILCGGDVTHNGDVNEEWTGVLAPEYLRNYPMAATPGNHDKGGTSFRYYFNHPNVYHGYYPSKYGDNYWFRYGDVLFVVLNSIRYEFIGQLDTLEFIKLAVEANPDAKWRVAMTHYDFYGTAEHVYEKKVIEPKERIAPALEFYDFDLVLTGHDHIYGRSYFIDNGQVIHNEGYNSGNVTDPDGMMYITASGSTGNTREFLPKFAEYDWIGMSYDVRHDCYSTLEFTDDGQFKLMTYDTITDELIDSFTINKTTGDEYEEKDVLGGMYGNILKSYMGEYFVVIELLNDCVNFFKKITSIFVK